MNAASIARLGVLALLILAAGIGLSLSRTETSRAGALGGPVIIGGDDLPDHGGVDGSGNVTLGWLYIKRALESIGPDATRGDGSIAALGSAASPETNFDAGAAIGAVAQEISRTVTYYNGDTAINQFFTDLAGGSANPSIIWISGDGASNDLSDGPGNEPAALTANAAAIASFVASGGGLMSHGSEFGWLGALLPDAAVVGGGSAADLYFTPEGTAALGSLTTTDINAGPWHNYFEGDFGGLQVLVRSNLIDDSTGQDAAVIIGGSQVTFEEQPPTPEAEGGSDCLPGVPGLPCGGQSGGGNPGNAQPLATPEGGDTPVVPTVEPTAVPPTAAPPAAAPTAPGGGRLGVISPPDTGTGDGTKDSGGMLGWIALAAAMGVLGGGAVVAGRRVRR
jgi:hypothetical protein